MNSNYPAFSGRMVKEVINEATEALRPSLLGDIMHLRMADGYV
jgi:hypothetical protein